MPAPGAALNSYTWEEIRMISDAGKASEYFSVGDTKSITINGKVGTTTFNNLTVDVVIIGIDHNSSREGTNRIHFLIGTNNGKLIGLVGNYYLTYTSESGAFTMNTTNSNTGGWASSHMRTTVLGSNSTPNSPTANTLLSALPNDLRTVMKPVTKYTNNTGQSTSSSAITATTDYLFLLSEYEVEGLRSDANQYEKNYQAQYQYFKTSNRIAYRHDSTSSVTVWHMRSPWASGTQFVCMGNNGSHFGSPATYSVTLVAGFTV